ncbi:hypothetical protein TCAL_11548 [Tigriopus californicus]|uniref:Chitin-binding type-4 domain-containing protein n=1 Tax=Tigriopus californicus TaxID=6832 RepID=A0A553NXX7_TIGCA|nr:uncharacterized protein LOC131887174 [Tigriopus californicus]TRY70276.1 hypothetical protein TCAL_11548 [Tigriopus californicus]|eukprot:TCALIF_11548-PA protein Name:"Protein of unknown function" AED:0.07 eAED:0.07 QI:71/1/1/1/1/1/7/149/354
MTVTTICSIILGLSQIHQISSHGYLADPPSRNVMWRYGFNTEVNYNDNELYCGGFETQKDNDGKCGVCGDNYADPQPRDHENGGKYGLGTIGRKYVMGQTIEVEVELSTNHWGWFELKLCPLNDANEITTQECLDQHPLFRAEDPSSSKYPIPDGTEKSAYLKYEVLLPQGITCSQCVIQWTYHTGNTWGDCGNGTSEIGCGAQENFVNCADIQIYSNAAGFPPNAIDNPSTIYFRDSTYPGGRRPFVNKNTVCIPTKPYEHLPNMQPWCQEQCLNYNPSACPKDKCLCLKECVSINELAGINGTDVFCHRNCLRNPPICPRDQCRCFSEEGIDTEGNTVDTEGRIIQAYNGPY